jgi:hypothetical protein
VRSSSPAFGIHSAEATTAWIKYYAKAYKNQAVELRAHMAERAAALVANHKHDIDRANHGLHEIGVSKQGLHEIGVSKQGLREATLVEWIWIYATGCPNTWRQHVRRLVKLAKRGVALPLPIECIKNHTVHGIQEAVHRVYDATQRVMDKVQYQADRIAWMHVPFLWYLG